MGSDHKIFRQDELTSLRIKVNREFARRTGREERVVMSEEERRIEKFNKRKSFILKCLPRADDTNTEADKQQQTDFQKIF